MLKYFWCFSSPWIWTKRRGRVYIGKALLLPLQKVEEVLKSTLYIEAKVISLCVFFAIPPFCKGSYKLRELGGPQKEGKMIENRWFVEKMTRFLMHFWSKLMKNRWKWRVSFCFFERHSWKIDENGLFPFVVLSDIAKCPCNILQAPRARGSTEGRENDWKSLICRENDAFPYAFLIETHEKSVKMTCFLLLFWAAFMKNRWKWLVSPRCFERHSPMSLYEPLQKGGYKFE